MSRVATISPPMMATAIGPQNTLRDNGIMASMAAAEVAREEGFNEIANWFETLAKAERSHANRFKKALDNLNLND